MSSNTTLAIRNPCVNIINSRSFTVLLLLSAVVVVADECRNIDPRLSNTDLGSCTYGKNKKFNASFVTFAGSTLLCVGSAWG